MEQYKEPANGYGRVACVLAGILAVGMTGNSAADDSDDVGYWVPAGTAAKNWYGGLRVGVGKIDYPDSNQDGSVTGISSDDTDTVSGFFGGYQVNENFAVQGGYSDMGNSDFSGTSSGGPSWEEGPVSAHLDANAWELGVLGRWPVAPKWYAIGYLGWSFWESTETFVEMSGTSVEKNSGSDFSYALGLEFDIGLSDRVVYRFMGLHQQVDDTSYDINSANFEIVYRFP